MRLARRARPLLAAYALLLVVILFSPTAGVQTALVQGFSHLAAHVVPARLVTFARMEVVLNAVIIMPISLLGTLSFPRTRWQDWTAYGFLGACVVEVFQGLFLPHRQASFSDVVANATGALLGALLGVLVVRVLGDRARRG